MKHLKQKIGSTLTRAKTALISTVCNKKGDQMTGWLICILLVVIVGAAFITIYNKEIVILWNSIVAKMKAMFIL